METKKNTIKWFGELYRDERNLSESSWSDRFTLTPCVISNDFSLSLPHWFIPFLASSRVYPYIFCSVFSAKNLTTLFIMFIFVVAAVVINAKRFLVRNQIIYLDSPYLDCFKENFGSSFILFCFTKWRTYDIKTVLNKLTNYNNNGPVNRYWTHQL